MLRTLSQKFNVPESILKAAVRFRPEIPYEKLSLVKLCNSVGYPPAHPESDPTVYAILAAYQLAGMGQEFLGVKAKFVRAYPYGDREAFWDYYVTTLFDDFIPTRLYINNKRVEYTYADPKGSVLGFTIPGEVPETSDYSRVPEIAVLINGSVYNISKLKVTPEEYVFIWTTQPYLE